MYNSDEDTLEFLKGARDLDEAVNIFITGGNCSQSWLPETPNGDGECDP